MFTRKALTYSLSSLEPFIDTETMNQHYNFHYKTYTDKLNAALNDLNIGTNGTEEEIIEILKNYQNLPKTIRNNGGGYYNHLLYFDNISPYDRNYQVFASKRLKSLIESSFGSYENFVDNFKKAGADVFGSGWVWLAFDGNRLMLLTTANQDNPVMSMDVKILMGMDVWEHAYYLKHKSNRKGYLDDFMNVVDWKVVSERLEKK